MHKGLFRIFPFILLLLACRPAAGGAAETVQLGPAELEGFFSEALLADAPLPRERLRVEHFSARPEAVSIPAGAVSWRTEGPGRGAFLGKKTMDLIILVDGREAATVRATGDIQLYGDVVCVTRTMRRGEVLAAGDLTVMHRNISNLGANLVEDPNAAVGRQLKATLRPGTPLYTYQLEEPALVKRGDLVTLLVESDALRLSAPGQVKEDGARGAVVRVKNLMSRKEVHGRVTGAGTVVVEY